MKLVIEDGVAVVPLMQNRFIRGFEYKDTGQSFLVNHPPQTSHTAHQPPDAQLAGGPPVEIPVGPMTLRQRALVAYPFTARIIFLSYAIYGGLALAVNSYSKRTSIDTPLCMFKRMTGHPCATCGGTRAASRLIQGDLFGALTFNPFVTVLLTTVVVWAVISFVRAGKPLIRWTPRRRGVAIFFAMFALAINWVYVWNIEPELTRAQFAKPMLTPIGPGHIP